MSFHYTGGRNVPQDRQLANFANALQKVCEMKYAAEDYVITKSEEEKFRRRMAILKAETNTKYSMIPTFVTPYGILRNSHSAFVMNDLKLDDLFVKL